MQIVTPHSPRNDHLIQSEDKTPLTGKSIDMKLKMAFLDS